MGIATIQNPKSMDIPWSRASLARLMPSMSLADPSLDETAGLRLAITINAEHADKFFEGTGHTIAEILAAADNDEPLPHFPLAVSIRAKVQLKKSQVESQNVAGLLTGSDPQLKNEYVVLTAHLDHVGVGRPSTAIPFTTARWTMLPASRPFSKSRACCTNRTPSSAARVLFLAVTGEEKGLQGSRYFAAHPTVNEKNIVADINLDMFLPSARAALHRGAGARRNRRWATTFARLPRKPASKCRPTRSRSAIFSSAAISTASSARVFRRWRSSSDICPGRPRKSSTRIG